MCMKKINLKKLGARLVGLVVIGMVALSIFVMPAIHADAQTVNNGLYTPAQALTYTLKYIAGPGGTISGPASQSVASGHSGIFVSATPNAGYTFTKWSDGSLINPRAETYVTANVTVTANFAPVGAGTYYTVSYTSSGGGTISGNSFQSVLQGSSSTTVTAIPNTGYVFYEWSDNGSTNPVRQDVNVTRQIAAEAEFTAIPSSSNTNINIPTVPTCTSPMIWSYATSSCQTPLVAQPQASSVVTPTPVPTTAQVLGSGACPADLLVTDNLRLGAQDGQYDLYQGGVVTQVHILQMQINRILAASYNDAAGPTDGVFGPLTKQGVERLQIALNQILNPNPLLKVDGIVGPFTKAQMNNSCGVVH